MAADLWLLVGLGNPGKRYQGNRHNVGFLVADVLASAGEGLVPRANKGFQGELAKGTLDGRPALLLKPQTFMNLSGRSAAAVAGFYEVPLERIVVVHDDVDLELGRLRVKVGGGDGGHKGIRSLAQELGGPGFARVRFGIGRPEVGEVEDFVLQDFRADERGLLEENVKRAAEAVRTVLGQGVKEAMNRFNGPPRPERSESENESKEARAKVERPSPKRNEEQ